LIRKRKGPDEKVLTSRFPLGGGVRTQPQSCRPAAGNKSMRKKVKKGEE